MVETFRKQARATGGHLFTPENAQREREEAKVSAYRPPEGSPYDYRKFASYQRRRDEARKRQKPFNDRYDTTAYRRAITRCLDEHGLPRWTPHQARHNAGTRLRRDFDLDAAQKVLNHANAKTTEIYAALDLAKAKEVMEKAG